MESTVSLVLHANQTSCQISTKTGQVLKEFTDSDDYQANLKAAQGMASRTRVCSCGSE